LADQIPHDAQGCPGFKCKGLGTPEPGIGRADRPGCREHGAAPVKHGERNILVGQPAESGKRYQPIGPDYYQTPKAMAHAGKPGFLTNSPDSIFKNQVAPVHADCDSIAK
jgi:hypothetical protein